MTHLSNSSNTTVLKIHRRASIKQLRVQEFFVIFLVISLNLLSRIAIESVKDFTGTTIVYIQWNMVHWQLVVLKCNINILDITNYIYSEWNHCSCPALLYKCVVLYWCKKTARTQRIRPVWNYYTPIIDNELVILIYVKRVLKSLHTDYW